jgi:hypothetical protein
MGLATDEAGADAAATGSALTQDAAAFALSSLPPSPSSHRGGKGPGVPGVRGQGGGNGPSAQRRHWAAGAEGTQGPQGQGRLVRCNKALQYPGGPKQLAKTRYSI